MKYNKDSYKKVVDEHTPKNKMFKNCVLAFIFGGTICTIGEIVKNIFISYYAVADDDAGVIALVVLIGLSAVLTGFGVYDNLGKYGGAGTIVPITGFANSVVAPALEYKKEGFVLGTAANMFKLAGPVLVYGYFASFCAGILSLLF